VFREEEIKKLVSKGKWQFAVIMVEGLRERR